MLALCKDWKPLMMIQVKSARKLRIKNRFKPLIIDMRVHREEGEKAIVLF